MDYIDILQGRFMNTYAGKFYKNLPNPSGHATFASGIFFDYQYVDTTTWHYQQLLSNVIDKESASVTVKTRENLDYSPGSCVSLQDGRLYLILSVTQDMSSAEKEAARIFPIPVGTEWVLRLVERENVWGLK